MKEELQNRKRESLDTSSDEEVVNSSAPKKGRQQGISTFQILGAQRVISPTVSRASSSDSTQTSETRADSPTPVSSPRLPRRETNFAKAPQLPSGFIFGGNSPSVSSMMAGFFRPTPIAATTSLYSPSAAHNERANLLPITGVLVAKEIVRPIPTRKIT